MTDTRKLKEKAAEAFAKGKFTKAAELYGEYCAADPKDTQARLRMGDAFARAGNRKDAIKAYTVAAESFAKEGFLPRAIAASKLIVELDPAHKGVQQMLAELYARRGTTPPGERPKRVEGGPQILMSGVPPARQPPARPEPPSPMNRPDAIELPPMDEPAPRVETRTEPAKAAGPVKAADPFDLAAQAPSARAAASEPDPFVIPVEEESQSGSSGPSYELSVDEAEPKRDAVPTYELSLEDAVSPVDHSSELPQELQRVPAAASVPAPAPAAPPPAASPAAASPVSEDVDIDIDIDEASAPAAAAPSGFAPPGLRRRQSSPGTPAAPPSPTALPPPAAAAPPLAAPPGLAPAQRPAPAPAASSRFDELDLDMAASVATRVLDRAQLQLDGDSLLHAVEAAARAALSVEPQPGPGGHEETVFTTEELAEAPHPGALPKIPLFSDLPPDAFIELFERCPLRRFSINATIIQQGSQGDSFFVICEGSVRVTREDEGERKELAILNEGAFFGEMALLSDAPRTASVESAAEDTQLLEISAQLLAELSSRYPSVAQALKKFCRQRMLSNVMNTSALFRPFNRGDRKQLVERFRARDVKKNDTIIREGDRTDGLYVLLSGEVEVRKGHQALARLKEGEIFGEMSLLQKSPATATVAATKRTSLLRLPREDFDELILSHPQILILVAELTEDRRRQTEAVLSGAAVHGEEGLLLV